VKKAEESYGRKGREPKGTTEKKDLSVQRKKSQPLLEELWPKAKSLLQWKKNILPRILFRKEPTLILLKEKLGDS